MFGWIKHIPKTITGITITAVGSLMGSVPVLQAASPWVIKAGAAIITAGGTAKAKRLVTKGEDPLKNEKIVINKFKEKKNEH